jgi:hypothetical protein
MDWDKDKVEQHIHPQTHSRQRTITLYFSCKEEETESSPNSYLEEAKSVQQRVQEVSGLFNTVH